MSTVEEIKKAISKLPESQYAQIRKWFSEEDWKNWDSRIEKDSATGALDFLVNEAAVERRSGKLTDL